ncbi:MAG: Fe2+-dependent dioxygenase [Burkholderiaceae bacterium]
MMVRIPGVLTPEQVQHCRHALATAEWADGRATAGYQSARVKSNLQLPEDHPVARSLGDLILDALGRNALFIAAALPLKVYPPLFNRYEGNGRFGSHIDNAIRQVAGTSVRVRTDISATLFLAEPDEYDGGELMVDDTYGSKGVKLPAGDMILYPGTSMHQVTPVTRGARLASFFWIQSLVRDDVRRAMLFDLDTAIQQLGSELPDHRAMVQLAGVYHNLIRHWSDT